MQRMLAEVIKDYQARGELVPVPAPMMMRPPPGMRPPHPSGMGGGGGGGAMGFGMMRPPMQMMGHIPSAAAPIYGAGLISPPLQMHLSGGMAPPTGLPPGGMYPSSSSYPMGGPMPQSQAHASVSTAVATSFPTHPLPQMDLGFRPPHPQAYQQPPMTPTMAPWHASGPAAAASTTIPQQTSYQYQQDHHQLQYQHQHQRN